MIHTTEKFRYRLKKGYRWALPKIAQVAIQIAPEVVGIIRNKILATIEEVLSMKFPFARDLGIIPCDTCAKHCSTQLLQR
jgi:hypothetical protein